MDELPAFIAIETGNDGDLPLSIAWTLPDGRVKHTLIQPDNDWLEDELVSLGDYSLEELNSMGVSPLDVIRELETDHFNATLYTAGVGDDEAALSRLFETYGLDPFVELAPADSLYNGLAPGEWARARGDMFGELGLEPMRPEEEIQVMLALHLRINEDT
ncbi:hypothetical protein ACJ7V3_16385 [Halomonas elongata]|uniref:Uncharacterized protein n=2 Tax=Halomonas elongata TaxID=2746 RepID=E1V872_HALED|nr:hypothetical protein [Halomonas elongata]MBW5802066.1 hypothetical protein [Halomonas elongata]MDL4861315.1 hypothetical protein [Halomonas elongata]OBX37520.1 hypothetical protein A8U91_01887 [Halomonas elongata]RAW06647.1 hypothetical protein DKQ62_12750 [Halomonas elongata]WBF18872.1 hypothetical protein LM502_04030 [Halomonas elongata]